MAEAPSVSKALTLIAIAAAALSATGCTSGMRQAIGAEKVAPDEFKVVTKAPLVMPPDFALRPPQPGAPRPQELRPDAEARAAIFGRDVGQTASEGERALIARAGADAVDPNVRAQIDLEAGGVVRKSEAFSDRLLGKDANKPLDAAAEQKRIQEEEIVRRATGGGQVTIERRDTSKSKLPGL
ncbi:MAG: DUF3035 domain-containing protein [Caulobacterales bacterium]|jgi:hypothetical protein